VAANAIKFAADLVKGNLKEVASKEFEMLNRIGWKDVLSKKEKAPAAELQEVKMPDPKPVAEEYLVLTCWSSRTWLSYFGLMDLR